MMTLRRSAIGCTALFAALVLASPTVRAQPEPVAPSDGDASAASDGEAASSSPLDGDAPPPSDVSPEVVAQYAKAAQLFDEGRTLMQEPGKLDEACDTLTASYALRRRGDTLLNLAECHRRQGRTATAWREFDEAIKYAEAVEFAEAIEAAKKLRDDLAKSLSELMVEVPVNPAPPADLEIMLDGKPLPPAQWRQPLFVDPGQHSATAKAKGYEPFDTLVQVHGKGHRAIIKVELKKIPEAPKPPPPKPAPAPPPPEEEELPVWAIVVGGTGLVMLGASVAFGVDTTSIGGDLDHACGDERLACPSNFDFDSARSQELRSFGFFVGLGIGGLIATGVGATVLGMHLAGGDSSSEGQPAVAVSPWAGPNGAGLAVQGTIW